MVKLKFVDELVNASEPKKSMGVFWEFLKIEIRNMNTIGKRCLRLAVVRGIFCPHGPGVVLIPKNFTSLPADAKVFEEMLAPFCVEDGLSCKYLPPDTEGDGEGIEISW